MDKHMNPNKPNTKCLEIRFSHMKDAKKTHARVMSLLSCKGRTQIRFYNPWVMGQPVGHGSTQDTVTVHGNILGNDIHLDDLKW